MTNPQEDAELRKALLDISGISQNSLNDTVEIFSITKLTRFIKARDEQQEKEIRTDELALFVQSASERKTDETWEAWSWRVVDYLKERTAELNSREDKKT